MPRLVKPSIQSRGGSFRPVSLAAAQAPGRAAAAIGNVTRNLGRIVAAEGQALFQRADAAFESAIYTNALTKAQEEFSKRVAERESQQVDKDGNPTYDSLPSDITSIGKDIQSKVGGSIFNPRAAAKFNQTFSKFTSNQNILARGRARSQKLSYARTSLQDGVAGFQKAALQDDQANMGHHINEANKAIDIAVGSGAITPEEGAVRKRAFARELRVEQHRKFITENPSNAAANIAADEDLLPDDRRRLLREANSAIADTHKKIVKDEKERQAVVRQQQSLRNSELNTGIVEGSIGLRELDEARNTKAISASQYQDRRRQLVKEQRNGESKRNVGLRISKSIDTGSTLAEFSPSQINSHYKDMVSLQKGPNGEAPSLAVKAQVASQYSSRVTSYETEIEHGVKFGDGSSALRAFEYSMTHKPENLEGMDKESTAIASTALQLVKDTNMSTQEAIETARKQVLEADDPKRAERSNAYKQQTEFNRDNIDETIQEALGGDDFFAEADLEPGLHARVDALLREGFVQTGTVKGAISYMQKVTKGKISKTEFNNGDTIMRFAPEAIFQGVPSEDLQAHLKDDIKDLPLPSGKTVEDVRIESNDTTLQVPGQARYLLYTEGENGEQIPVLNKDGSQAVWTVSGQSIGEFRNAKALEKAREGRQQKLESQQRTQEFQEMGIRGGGADASELIPSSIVPEGKGVYRVGEQNVRANDKIGRAVKKGIESGNPMDIARAFLGKHEKVRSDAIVLSNFFKKSAGININPKHTPWCAAFVNAIFESKGVSGTGSLAAKSFLKWGSPTSKPSQGDVVVFHRTSNPAFGHVGFYVREESRGGRAGIIVLGGNQGNKVSEAWYPKSRLAGYRKPPKADEIQDIIETSE